MPLFITDHGFLALRDQNTDYVNFSVIFKAADREIYDENRIMDYFSYDLFETDQEPQTIDYHISKGNVKVINGDYYFKNSPHLVDGMISYIDIDTMFVQSELLMSYTNGNPILVLDTNAMQDRIREEPNEKQRNCILKWKNAIADFNKRELEILKDPKYRDELYFEE